MLDKEYIADFVGSFKHLSDHVNYIARTKGFYDEPPSDVERIALMMEELGDCIKAIRAVEMPMDPHCPEYTRLEVKLADTIIRIMDYSVYRGLRVSQALLDKIAVNAMRPYKHGKKI